MLRSLAGTKGTRFQPPEPLIVLLASVMPGNTPFAEVLAEFMVAETGWALANVVMADSSQPFTRNFANGELLVVIVGRRSEEHTSELQSLRHLVCRLLL